MCIAIHSDGHLDVILLYEQNLPKLVTHSDTKEVIVQFTECYDIFFRSYTRQPIDHLYVLSPYHPTGKSKLLYKLLSPNKTRQFDWIFENIKDIDGIPGANQVTLMSFSPDRKELPLGITGLDPKPPQLMFEESPPVSGTIVGAGMTFMRIGFKGEQKIHPYDPNKSSETTYWLRLSYQPEIEFSIKPAITFGPPDGPFVRVRPCRGYSSQAVLNALDVKLDSLAHEVGQGWTDQAKAEVHTIFEKVGTSTTIREHRIALITDQKFLVLNPNVEGPCRYACMDSIGKDPDRIGRIWFAGCDHFWETNVATVARRVYSYLNEPGFVDQAVPLEKISMATGFRDYNNLCHVMAILKEIEVVIEDPPRYYIVGPKAKQAEFLIQDETICDNLQVRDEYNQLLSMLNGPYRFMRSQGKWSKFQLQGFKIEYELVFAPGGDGKAKA